MSPRAPRPPRLASALPACLLASVGAWAAVEWSTHAFALERSVAVARATGYGATLALAAALLVTPAVRMLERLGAAPGARTTNAYRRALGTSAAWLGLAHGAFALATYLDGAFSALVRPYLRSGAVAAAILAVLLVTSFPPLVRLLRVQLWKELHRAAYVAALFVFQHVFLSPFAPRRATLLAAAALAAAWATRFLPRSFPARAELPASEDGTKAPAEVREPPLRDHSA